MRDIDIINNIKSLGIDMIDNAKSGHPGIVLSAAPIVYALYAYNLNVNPNDPTWFNRDRFVLSAGHGSALLYSTLFMCGYNLSIDDLKQFRRANSKTPGHPEVDITPGVDCTTGPLGQGFATSVGMALGQKILKERYRISKSETFIDYKVYCLVGDGDLMEGISYEAASLAGHLKLNNLIVLYDSNNMSLDGSTDKTFTENVRSRFESMGWTTYLVRDGNNLNDINKAIDRAKYSKEPVFIEVKTKLGDGSLLENTNVVHGKCLSKDDINQLKSKFNIVNEPFYYYEGYIDHLRVKINTRIDKKYRESNEKYKKYINLSDENRTFANYMFNNDFNFNLFKANFDITTKRREATRDTNKEFIDFLSHYVKTFVGGSADLGSTTKTMVNEYDNISADNFNGSNIWYGVREHAMGAISNGLALVNLKPYCSTFLSFSDYLKPAIRMSSLMKLPVTYIFSHDSIYVGPDGPTHQPVEHLSMLRSIPNLKVYRPADIKELLGCWQLILNSNNNPSVLILSRNEVEQHNNTSHNLTILGGYIYYNVMERPDYVIVATGTELTYARNITYELINKGHKNIRIVSMPCVERFLEQPIEYRNKIIPPESKVIVLEAGSSFGWHRIAHSNLECITIDDFGVSGSSDEVLHQMNFDYDTVRDRIFEIVNK